MNEHWQIIVTLVSIMVILGGFLLWAVKFIVNRALASHQDGYKNHLIEAAERCDEAAKKCADVMTQGSNIYSVERQLLELKAQLPNDYVQKPDFIRHEVVINTKLDRMNDKMDTLISGGNRAAAN